MSRRRAAQPRNLPPASSFSVPQALKALIETPARRGAVLCAILAFSVIVRLPFIPRPYEPDEATYALIAQKWLQGAVPYQGMADQKPPGIFAVYALAIKLFGLVPKGIHVFCALYNLLTVAAVWALGGLVAGPGPAALSALFFALFSGAPRLCARANVEIFMALPYALSSLFFVAGLKKDSAARFFAAGLAAGAAVLFKQTAATQFLLFGLLAVFEKRALPRILRVASWTALGAAAALFPVCAYFAAKGAFGDLIYWTMRFGMRYVNTGSFWDHIALPGLGQLGASLVQEQALLAAGLALLAWKTPALEPRKRNFLWIWLATSYAGVAAGTQAAPHYFVQLLPAACLAAAQGWSMVRLSPGLALAAAAATGWFLTADGGFYFLYPPEESVARQYAIYYLPTEIPPAGELKAVAEYVRDRTKEGDRIQVLGLSPEIYLLAGREPSSRLIENSILLTTDPSLFPGFSAELRAHRPVYLICDKKYLFVDEKNVPYTTGYHVVAHSPHFDVYRAD